MLTHTKIRHVNRGASSPLAYLSMTETQTVAIESQPYLLEVHPWQWCFALTLPPSSLHCSQLDGQDEARSKLDDPVERLHALFSYPSPRLICRTL